MLIEKRWGPGLLTYLSPNALRLPIHELIVLRHIPLLSYESLLGSLPSWSFIYVIQPFCNLMHIVVRTHAIPPAITGSHNPAGIAIIAMPTKTFRLTPGLLCRMPSACAILSFSGFPPR